MAWNLKIVTQWVLIFVLGCSSIPNTIADDFTASAITITLSKSLSIDLERGRDFRFGFAAKVDKSRSDKKISGTNLWKISAWFGSSEDGSGDTIGYVDQVFNSGQAGTSYKKSPRLTINGVSYSLPPVLEQCSSLRYFCVRFSATDAPELSSGQTLNVNGSPDDSVLTECVDIPQCTENTNICIQDSAIYNAGDIWKPRPCQECTCIDGIIECQEEVCQTTCAFEYRIYNEGVCCPSCPTSCQVDGNSYAIDSTWQPDVCTRCTCVASGNANCTTDECISLPCPGGQQQIHHPGVCCPVCPLECEDNGVLYLHQEKWMRDVCTSCDCFDGNTQCDVELCPSLNCNISTRIKAEDECCPICALDCFYGNSPYSHGALWSADVCTDCSCYNGSNNCVIQNCPPLSCPADQRVTRHGECCSVCGEGCSYNDQDFGHLDRWSPDPCTLCECNDGIDECAVTSCDTPICDQHSRVVTLEGECCPSCSEGSPLILRSNLVKIKFGNNGKLKLGAKRAKLSFTPIINFENADTEVTGSNLWAVTAWLSSNVDGNSKLARVHNMLSTKQSSSDLIPNERLYFGPTKVKFKIRNPKCNNKLKYICIRFDLTDNPLADGVSLFLDPNSVVQSCAPIPTCRQFQK